MSLTPMYSEIVTIGSTTSLAACTIGLGSNSSSQFDTASGKANKSNTLAA